MDMSPILNSETPEAWLGDCRTNRQKEMVEPTDGMKKAVSPCSEMTIVKKYEKHYIDISSKKDTTTTENSPKAQDVKTKMLKQFIQSQIDEDTSHQDKIRVTGTLERNTHITNKDNMDDSVGPGYYFRSCFWDPTPLQFVASRKGPLLISI